MFDSFPNCAFELHLGRPTGKAFLVEQFSVFHVVFSGLMIGGIVIGGIVIGGIVILGILIWGTLRFSNLALVGVDFRGLKFINFISMYACTRMGSRLAFKLDQQHIKILEESYLQTGPLTP